MLFRGREEGREEGREGEGGGGKLGEGKKMIHVESPSKVTKQATIYE